MANFPAHMSSTGRFSIALAALLAIGGCADDNADLRARVAEVKSRPGGRIEPLPEVKPYETFAYGVADQRSPFEAGAPAAATSPNALRPDPSRPREFLEQFSLDTLRMVGTLNLQGRKHGLVQTRDGLVHRVLPGNYIGQSDGRITAIDEGKISLIEIVPDGMGGFIERPAALALRD
jgi:type IV pilus assembly protein PilP